LSAAQRAQLRILVAAMVMYRSRPSRDGRARRLPTRLLAKREAQKREGRVRTVNLAASSEAKRQLLRSRDRESRSAERKRARGLHRQGRKQSC
jgi:hypothetical protein